MNWGVFGAIMAAGLLWEFAARALERRIRRSRLAGRTALSDADICKLFADLKVRPETVLQVWYEIASALHVNPGLLRPEDTFLLLNTSRDFRVNSDLEDLEHLLPAVAAGGRDPRQLENLGDLVRSAAPQIEAAGFGIRWKRC